MISQSIIGVVTRSDSSGVVIRIPGDTTVIKMDKKIYGVSVSAGDEVVLVSVPVNKWILMGKLVDV